MHAHARGQVTHEARTQGPACRRIPQHQDQAVTVDLVHFGEQPESDHCGLKEKGTERTFPEEHFGMRKDGFRYELRNPGGLAKKTAVNLLWPGTQQAI